MANYCWVYFCIVHLPKQEHTPAYACSNYYAHVRLCISHSDDLPTVPIMEMIMWSYLLTYLVAYLLTSFLVLTYLLSDLLTYLLA